MSTMIRVVKCVALMVVIALLAGSQGTPLLPESHPTLPGGVAGGGNEGAVSSESPRALAEQQTTNIPPVASFTQSATTVDPGVPVSFDASSSFDPDGVVISYTWDFGEGTVTTVTEPRISHTYSPQCHATFTVTLRVTDNGGAISSPASSTITVAVVILPYTMKLTPGIFQANVGQVLTFTVEVNPCSHPPPIDYLWDFGDGTTAFTPGSSSSTDVKSHMYTLPGPVTVRVTVVDSNGSIESLEAFGHVQSVLRFTSTNVSCSPSTTGLNQEGSCIATVTDSSSGAFITPTGSVSFSTSGTGFFSPGSCTLTGTGVSASCSVSYTPTARADGSHIITGSYVGDASHQGGSGTFTIIIIIELVVSIDVKPGSDPNSVNVRSTGLISVAVLTTASFDASTVDPSTVRFGRTGTEASAVRSALEDVDKDHDLDLVLHFNIQDTQIKAGDTRATVTGRTLDGTEITGTDSIRAFFPGDVNGDFVVNVLDLALVGRAFGSTSGSLSWSPYADFNEDGRVDVLDLAVVGAYFGQHA